MPKPSGVDPNQMLLLLWFMCFSTAGGRHCSKFHKLCLCYDMSVVTTVKLKMPFAVVAWRTCTAVTSAAAAKTVAFRRPRGRTSQQQSRAVYFEFPTTIGKLDIERIEKPMLAVTKEDWCSASAEIIFIFIIILSLLFIVVINLTFKLDFK